MIQLILLLTCKRQSDASEDTATKYADEAGENHVSGETLPTAARACIRHASLSATTDIISYMERLLIFIDVTLHYINN